MVSHRLQNVDKIRFNHGQPFFVGLESTEIPIKTNPHTYIVFDPKTRLCKIGRSTNYEVRIKQIQVLHKTIVEIVNVLPFDIERKMHEMYSVYHVHGEWFYLSPRIIEEIRGMRG